MKYLLFDIQYNEQFFKQFAGALFFLSQSISNKCTLVLPHFRSLPKDENNYTVRNGNNYGYHPWERFYDLEKIKSVYKVITIEEFSKLNLEIDLLCSKTDMFIKDDTILISNIPFKFKKWERNTAYNYANELKSNNVLAICGTTNQLPFSVQSYKVFRKNIKYHDYLYDTVDNFLKSKNIDKYISVHWRQTDFIIVRGARSDVLRTVEQVVERCKEHMKKYNINHVYIATDSKDKVKLKYLEDNLPLFKFDIEDEVLHEKYMFAVIESIICAKAEHFYGTYTSLYSINICGERLILNKPHDQIYL